MELGVGTSNTSANSSSEPRDVMEFDTHEAAYEYYKEYAKSVGFGTAKLSSRRSRSSKEFIDAKFSCIRYGNKQQSDHAINPRPSPKIGCKASMHVKRSPNGKWYIHSFVKEHNHELLPDQVHFFRSHRNPESVSGDAKVRKKKSLGPVLKQYGAYQFSDSYLDNVIRNQNDRGRFLSLEEGGAKAVLEFCVNMHEANPKFCYTLDFNEVHKLRNVFWVDGKGVEDYAYFGDVVSFDTTYYSSKYKIPLVLFIGMNNHVQPTLLGCGLIADETLYTFVWLMQSWLLAMGGKSPKVILTDQNEAVKSAVQLVLPGSSHFFHLWNVLEKVPRRLDYLRIWHDSFMEKLNKCISRSFNEEQFEKRWWKLIDRFSLREDQWIQSLYEERKLWVPLFLKEISFACLFSAPRSESFNTFFDRYIHAETSLKEFLGRYASILEEQYEEEAKANFDAWHETPELKSPSPFEKQMLLVYTHEVFKKFQIEILGASACHLRKENGDNSALCYLVKDFESNQEYRVVWDEIKPDLYCSCRLFEYKGYLCRHAILVLQMSGVFSIPYKYVLQRWTNAAKSKIPLSENFDEVQAKIRRYNDLCRRAVILGEEGSLSRESYDTALGAINDALKQCADANKPIECGTRLIGESQTPALRSGNSNNVSKRGNCEKQATSSSSKMAKIQPQPEIARSGVQLLYQHTDMSGTLDYNPSLYPTSLTTLLKEGDMPRRSMEMLGEMLEEEC